MRVLGAGACIDLGDCYLNLRQEGHEVRVAADDASQLGTFGGLIEPVADWRAELGWVGRDGLILFENTHHGAAQDALRREGYRVVGGSAYGDRLENDRAFGQAALQQAGLPVAASRAFSGPAAALEWLSRNVGRYVLKHDDPRQSTLVGEHPDGADVAFVLRHGGAGRVMLMDWLDGVEVGVGAYFDGQRFLAPACIDFEHKRFFPGEMGEMTGEMGTLASYQHAEPLFAATLGRMQPQLATAGHVGYVNLNMIVNEQGTWPLEFTCRFGYPGSAVLAELQCGGWGDLFGRMLDGRGDGFATVPRWSVGIVLTMPPYPGGPPGGLLDPDLPIFFREPPVGEAQRHYRFVDVQQTGGQLFARKRTGQIMVVTGSHPSVAGAQQAALARARNVIVPEIRWRNDIGDRFLRQDEARLRAWGWLPSS